MSRTFWDAHAVVRLTEQPPVPREPPVRMEWTQTLGIGPGAEFLGSDLTGRRIVELGCGAGHNAAHLAAAGATVTGVDSSAGQIRRALGHYAHTGAEFLHVSATDYLRQYAEPLDIIVSVFGAIGIDEPATLLTACVRRLNHTGVLAFALPHPQRGGTVPADPHTLVTVPLADGTTGTLPRWEMRTTAWTHAVNRVGLRVTSVRELWAPADAPRPTTLLLRASKP